MSKGNRIIVLLIVLGIVAYACWRIVPYLPFFPHYVRLASAEFLRSPSVYTIDSPGFDPAHPPLVPEWVKLSIDRKTNQIVFGSNTGEKVSAALGKPRWVQGCENQYLMEAYPLAGNLTLGTLTFQQPVLIVVCDMWAMSEKIRPARVVIMEEADIPEKSSFFMGLQCDPEKAPCLVFAEALSELVGNVVDADTGEALPTAHITLSNGLGVQEFTGSFRLPLYANIQVAYQVSMPGYQEKVGKTFIFYGTKMGISYFTNADHTQGQSDMLELPGYGHEVEYSFKLSKK